MNIQCDTVGCNCPGPAGDKMKYTFTYVCNDQNIIYYDVPKAGSTTIRNLLFPHAWPEGEAPCYNSTQEKIQPNRDYISFAFVRNPFSRMVSVWKHFTSHPRHIKQLKSSGININKCKDFSGFVEMTKTLHNHHWQPQTLFVPADVNYIGKLERFQEGFNNVCDMIKHKHVQLPMVNKTQHEHYTTYYTDRLIQVVSEMYDEDLTRFKYTFTDS